ncbi:hypothetical protein DM860_003364 [Cuscuta australis]|uniref:ADF-H domain-containing protein n=1 Tax=Cuscuta australis TaxID=267555 RepID=A0A328DFL1_9ASTE|nr:hypothetical protein DM860_003364 [Cuscuta australis]
MFDLSAGYIGSKCTGFGIANQREDPKLAKTQQEHSKNTFAELQRKKVYRYVVFKIDERKKEVVVEKSYDDFTASLPIMLSMTLILLPQRTAKRAKFSSLHGEFCFSYLASH